LTQPIKQLIKKAVRVVAPSPPPPPPAAPAFPPPPPELVSPILGHVPGVDKAEYGDPAHPAVTGAAEYSIEFHGRTRRIFFLCGHPRSGTHWMDNVIDRHPKAAMHGEFRFEALWVAYDDMTGKGWHACYREPMKSEAWRCFRESVRRIIVTQVEKKPTADWCGDRTPRALKVFLPGAPHFYILRDPRDVLVSWAHQEIKNAGHNYRTGNFETEMGEDRQKFVADPGYYNAHPELLFKSERFLRHLTKRWRQHIREDMTALREIDQGEVAARVRVIRYERIHADPEGERGAMYRFLGLDPSEAMPLDDQSKSKPGVAVENPHAIYRKGVVGDWERYFSSDARRWFKDETGEMLMHLGYGKDMNW
jgi:Sulfotransferase domain